MTTPAGSSRLGRALARAWYESHLPWPERVLLGAMAPASWAFGAASRLRGLAYDRGWLDAHRASIPVVSVGNLAVGGTGKTPVVLELLDRLTAAGHRPAVLSRGYGGAEGARVVCEGQGPCLSAAEAGDEPLLLARRRPEALILAGPDRAHLAELAARLGATVAILDDGLQHRRLARDLEVVVVDASDPLGNGHHLPRGPLREGPQALGRADLVWLSRVDEVPARAFGTRAALERLLHDGQAPVVRSRYAATDLCDGAGRVVGAAETLAGRRVVVLAGVARPQSFLQTLAHLGACVVGTHLFGDHHVFSEAELARAESEARRCEALLVTTEKDAARLPGPVPGLLALRVALELVDGREALDALLGQLPHPEAGPGRRAVG